jgi:hypothetical protein
MVSVPFAPGGQWQNSGPHEEVPPAHVARPHPRHPVNLTPTVGGGTVTITGIFNSTHGSADILPERVKPKGEPTEEPDNPPTAKGRRKGPRRRRR